MLDGGGGHPDDDGEGWSWITNTDASEADAALRSYTSTYKLCAFKLGMPRGTFMHTQQSLIAAGMRGIYGKLVRQVPSE